MKIGERWKAAKIIEAAEMRASGRCRVVSASRIAWAKEYTRRLVIGRVLLMIILVVRPFSKH